jgi:hypothetical protein
MIHAILVVQNSNFLGESFEVLDIQSPAEEEEEEADRLKHSPDLEQLSLQIQTPLSSFPVFS